MSPFGMPCAASLSASSTVSSGQRPHLLWDSHRPLTLRSGTCSSPRASAPSHLMRLARDGRPGWAANVASCMPLSLRSARILSLSSFS